MRRLLILVAALALLTAACKIEINAEFTINEDKSGSVTLEFGLDDEVMALAQAESPEDLFSEMDTDLDIGDVPGATTRTERRDDMTFYIVEVPVDDITAAAALGDQGAGFEGLTEDFEISFTEDRVIVRGSTSLQDALGDAGGGEELGGITPEMMSEFFEVNLRITMPGGIVDHNADEVDGNTLTWRIDLMANELDIYAESDPTASSGGIPIWVWFVIGGGVVALLAAFLILMGRRNPKPAVATPAPPTGEAPPPPPPSE